MIILFISTINLDMIVDMMIILADYKYENDLRKKCVQINDNSVKDKADMIIQ